MSYSSYTSYAKDGAKTRDRNVNNSFVTTYSCTAIAPRDWHNPFVPEPNIGQDFDKDKDG